MSDGKTILDADAIQRGLTRVAHEIAERNTNIDCVGLLGIQRGGIHLANRLAKLREENQAIKKEIATLGGDFRAAFPDRFTN